MLDFILLKWCERLFTVWSFAAEIQTDEGEDLSFN